VSRLALDESSRPLLVPVRPPFDPRDGAVMETEAVVRASVATLTLLMLALPAAAQPLRPAVKQAQCPLGYMQSGGYCMPMGRNPPSAVPKRPPVASPLSRFLLPRGT
jgi:hypothetical protein